MYNKISSNIIKYRWSSVGWCWSVSGSSPISIHYLHKMLRFNYCILYFMLWILECLLRLYASFNILFVSLCNCYYIIITQIHSRYTESSQYMSKYCVIMKTIVNRAYRNLILLFFIFSLKVLYHNCLENVIWVFL